jgi:hypothetical protein
MRCIGVLLCAALLASAAASLRSLPNRSIAVCGLLFAFTPTTAFLTGIVNPNGIEVSAAIAVWASASVLVVHAESAIDTTIVHRTGIAMTAVVLTRALSPFWLAIIAASCLMLGSRRSAFALLRCRPVQIWMAIVVTTTIVATAWILLAGPLDSLYPHGPDPGPVSTWTLLRQSLGSTTDQYRMMVSFVGWVDTLAPGATYYLWTAAIGLLVLLAVGVSSRRLTAVLAAVITMTLLVPVAIDVSQARSIGLGWQGRWTLPLAVGVPIIAAIGIATSRAGVAVARSRLPVALGACFAVAQFLAFAQALRRYTVGAHGPLGFWRHPLWTPPVPTWFVVAGAAVVIAGLAVALLWPTVDPEPSVGTAAAPRASMP